MNAENDDQLQQLEDALRTTKAAPDDPARRLAEALVPDDSYSHEQAERDLDRYVTDELLGLPAPQQYPDLHRHLLNCQECAALHLAMLQDLFQEPPTVTIPPARLPVPVPQPYLVRLRRFVEEATEGVMQALQPAYLGDLALVVEVFFDQVGNRIEQVALQPAAQTAFNFSGSTPISLPYVAATAVSSYQLGAELAAGRLAGQRKQDQLKTAIHATALQAATNFGMGREALPFADEFTRMMLDQIDSLPRPD